MNTWSRSLQAAHTADTLASIALLLGALIVAGVVIPIWLASR
jgi:hypothetical protein